MKNSIIMTLRGTATEWTARIRLRYWVPMVAVVALASSHVFTPATAQTIELPVSPNSLIETSTSEDLESVKPMVAEDNALTAGGSNSSHTSATVSPATLVLLNNDALPVLQTTDVADEIRANDKMLEAISAPHGTQRTVKVGHKKAIVSTVSEVQMAVTRAQPVSVTAEAPTVTITGPDGPVNGLFYVTITFSEAVTGFDVTDITVGNGTTSIFRISTAGIAYRATITPATIGEVTVDVAAGVASATSTGIDNAAAERYTVQVDSIVRVRIVVPGDYSKQPEIDVRFYFSSTVNGFESSDIEVTNGTVSYFGGPYPLGPGKWFRCINFAGSGSHFQR